MASTCPQCHQVVAEDLVCCADLQYTWECMDCHKLSSGFAIPYGKCFLCGGGLKVVQGYELEDPMKVRPIRDAVQFELNSYHFYKLALARAEDETMRALFEQLYLHEMDHLQLLQERYHTHLGDEVLNLAPDAEKLLAEELFRDIDFADSKTGPAALYDKAIEMERRTREHFRSLARMLPDGPEQDICLELAAEEEEHVALLETEKEHFIGE